MTDASKYEGVDVAGEPGGAGFGVGGADVIHRAGVELVLVDGVGHYELVVASYLGLAQAVALFTGCQGPW